MRRILFAVVIIAVGLAFSQAAPARESSPFEVVIELDGRRWTAECAEGCAWTRVTYTCAGECSVLLDSRGIASALDVPNADITFAFQLDQTDKGWTAMGMHGTAWTRLAWGCRGLGSCKARVDASGVGPS